MNQPDRSQTTLEIEDAVQLPGSAVPLSRIDDHPLVICLSEVARRRGLEVSPTALVQAAPIDNAVTFVDLIRIAESHQMTAAIRSRRLEEISAVLLPCILKLKEGACVLISVKDGMATISDGGAIQEMKAISLKDLSEQYSGDCLLIAVQLNSDSRSEVELDPRPSAWFWSVIWRYKREFSEAAFTSVILNVLALAGTFFSMSVYDRVIPNQAYITLWGLFSIAAAAMVFELGFRNLRAWLLDGAARRIDLVLGSRLFRQMLVTRLEHKARSSGAQANILREYEGVRDFVASATLTTLADLPFLFLFLLLIFVMAGPLVWVPAIAVVLIVIPAIMVQGTLQRLIQSNLRENSVRAGIVVESIEGIETLKNLGAEGRMLSMYERSSAVTAQTANKTRMITSVTSTYTMFVQQIASAAILVWGAYLIGEGKITMGALIATVMLMGRCLAPVSGLVGLAVRYQQTKNSLKSLNRIMALPTERMSGRTYLSRPRLTGEVGANNLSYSYNPHSPPAIRGINVRIQAGERVAILGRNGSGKSTFLKIAAGLLHPSSGSILIDGIDSDQIDPADLRRGMGYISQDTQLFFGTLKDNLMLGLHGVDSDRLLEITRLTGVAEFANRHPMGFDMPIGERGDGLSGGQRQAVALARLLLRDPSVLVLDEPTSALDFQSERQFMNALNQSIGQRTLLLVTHKPAMLEFVNRIVILDGGVVVADGPKDIVLKQLQEGKVSRVARPGETA